MLVPKGSQVDVRSGYKCCVSTVWKSGLLSHEMHDRVGTASLEWDLRLVLRK